MPNKRIAFKATPTMLGWSGANFLEFNNGDSQEVEEVRATRLLKTFPHNFYDPAKTDGPRKLPGLRRQNVKGLKAVVKIITEHLETIKSVDLDIYEAAGARVHDLAHAAALWLDETPSGIDRDLIAANAYIKELETYAHAANQWKIEAARKEAADAKAGESTTPNAGPPEHTRE